MDRKKLAIRVLSLIAFIFAMNYLAIWLHWYYSMWWFDMPMHFLGGLWVGLALLWVLPQEESSLDKIFQVFLFVLIIGVGWEIFEFIVNETLARNPFDLRDTLSDIFFDISGGMTAMFYFLTRIMRIPQNAI